MSVGGRPGGSARRAVVRWAWRLFRREWRQQLLVLSLMTLAVTVAAGAAIVAVTASSASNAQFGAAGAMARLDAGRLDLQAEVAAARQRFGLVEVIGHTAVAVPGSAVPLDVRSQDPQGVFGRSLLALRQGRYPIAAGEIALTRAAADTLGVKVGDHVELGGVPRVVVGRVENPSDLKDEFALTAFDERAPAASLTLLFDEPTRGDAPLPSGNNAAPIDFGIVVHGDNGPVTVLVLIAATLAMALVALIAAVGFVVIAQRRQRQLGLLAAIGATERHLRLVMLANGAIVGAVAAVIGIALAVVGWILTAPAVEVVANQRIDRLALPWGLMAGCGAIAVVMATAAAWWPARSVARLPVMTALSGRPSRPLPVRRSLVLAVALLAIGISAIAASHPTAVRVQPVVLIVGVLGIVSGVVLAAPAAIRALAAPAGRLPFASRLALRDLARYQARAAAALAAITLGLGISVAIGGVAKANEYRAGAGNLSDRQVLVQVAAPPGADRGLVTTVGTRDGTSSTASRDADAATVAATLGDPAMFALDMAVSPSASGATIAQEPVLVGTILDAHSTRMVGWAYVATPELLRHYGIDPGSIHDATDLLTVRTDNVTLIDLATVKNAKAGAAPVRPEAIPASAVQRVDLPSFSSAPNSLITENALVRHGWTRVRAGWLIETDHRITSAQIAAARSAAAKLGLTIETRSRQDQLAAIRTVATGVGALLALGIVAMTIGLIRSEGARDVRTLTATGASAHTRRALTASAAGGLALAGAVLGTIGAYAALLAGYHAQLWRLTPLPVSQLLAIGVGLPVAAAVAGWLLAGREPRTFARQTLD